ncbi:cytochrome P450 [Lactarius vividus]|nr:cytochrome P450 [Lactarius vividus]
MSYFLVATPLVGLVLWLIARLPQRAFYNLPPGPKGLPFVGDVKLASDHGWLASPQRKDDYGILMYLNVFGRGILILVLNSQRVAVDLLKKRSNIYSDRPRFISVNECLTENLSFVSTGYGDLWRRFCRPAVEGFSKSVVPDFYPVQSHEAIMLALALINSAHSVKKHVQRHAWSITLTINYHLPPVESEDDLVIIGIVDHVQRVTHELEPGARLVEFFSWIRYIPSRFFAKWKRYTQYWFIQDSLRHERLQRIDQPSFSATLIKNQEKYRLSEREQAWLVSDMLSAGGDTTSNTLHWWLLALLAHPEVQVRAHAELDQVVGSARPPTFADLPSLPYIRAMVKEALRWSPATPLGVPHASSADDWYEGMFIPKSTIVLPNMGLINSDPTVFGSDSARFNPARYLDKEGQVKMLMDGREEGHVSFGYWRRLCPGRFVAEGTLGIDFATLLWAIRFERPEDAGGELDMHAFAPSGIAISYPVPFECKAIPRFAEAGT